jgi:hypothetical protein
MPAAIEQRVRHSIRIAEQHYRFTAELARQRSRCVQLAGVGRYVPLIQREGAAGGVRLGVIAQVRLLNECGSWLSTLGGPRCPSSP